MQTLTRTILDHHLGNKVLTEGQLARLVEGTPQRRYHLVNRAMKAGEILRLKRGIYILEKALRDYPGHPFAIAQALAPGSYISLETSLAFHGWIPESVFATASILPGRKTSELTHPTFGKFTFHPLAIEQFSFMELVSREKYNQQTFLIAKPARALMDLVCLRKQEWTGIGWLTESLRIEEEHLRTISNADIRTLRTIYRQNRVKQFLKALAMELGND